MLYYFECYGSLVTTHNIITKETTRFTPEFPGGKFTGAAAWAPYNYGLLMTGGLVNDTDSELNGQYVNHVWYVNTDKWTFEELPELRK